jgi:hypothetical protein
VVGGLVEEQYLGVAGESGGDRQPLAPTPRELVDGLLGRLEAQLFEGDSDTNLSFGLVLDALRVERRAARRHLDDRGRRLENVVLRDHGDAQLAAAVELAVVRFLGTGQDAQHRRLACAVGSYDSDAVTL